MAETTDKQKKVFMDLIRDIDDNERWENFLGEWKGFMMTIIKKRLYYNSSLWEDALMDSEAKLFLGHKTFKEGKEPAPWLAQLVSNICKDIIKNNPPEINPVDIGNNNNQDNEMTVEEWIDILTANPEGEPESELFDDVWYCINIILEKLDDDERKKTAFIMFYKEGYKLYEIAQVFRLEQSTVNNWPGSILKKILPDLKAELKNLGYAVSK